MRREGFALVTSMVVIALIVGVVLTATARAQGDRLASQNIAIETRARAAARAGLAHGLLRLRVLQAETLSNPNSLVIRNAWNRLDSIAAAVSDVPLGNDGYYRVAMTDPASRLPLNHASPAELERLLTGLGMSPQSAEATAHAIVHIRDTQGAFGSIEDIVPYVIEPLPQAWRETLTVLGDGRVNLNAAGPDVLRALPGMSDDATNALLARRANGQWLESIHMLESLVTGSALAEMRANFQALAGRAAFVPVLIELSATGRIEGARSEAVISAVLARGASVRMIASVER